MSLQNTHFLLTSEDPGGTHRHHIISRIQIARLRKSFTQPVLVDHPTVHASSKTNFDTSLPRAASCTVAGSPRMSYQVQGTMILAELAKQFVPEDGISGAVLEDKLHAYFPRGARIEKRIQLGKEGPIGWFIAGGIVTDSIIEKLRQETRRETDPSSYNSIRDARMACDQVMASNSIRGNRHSLLNDRYPVPDVPPLHPSNLSLDGKVIDSSTGTRHQKVDSEGVPQYRKHVSFADPAIAVRYPEREQYTKEDFADFQLWKEYLHLKSQWTSVQRHHDVTASSVVPPPPPYQLVDVAANSRQPQSGRDAGERNKDASAPPGNLPTPSRHATHNENDRPLKNGEDGDTDDEPTRCRRPAVRRRRHHDDYDSDFDSDVIIEEVVRKPPWSNTVTTTMRGSGGHCSRRRRGGRGVKCILYER